MNTKNTQALDAPLIALTQQCGGDLTAVLSAFFSFLHRRTDFYLVPHEDDVRAGTDQMGFREGEAEKLLLAAFRQFPLRRLPKVGAKNDSKITATLASSNQESETKETTSTTATTATATTAATTTTTKPTSKPKDEEESVRLTEDGLQVPIGNGGSTPRYKWTQTLEECSVLIRVPENTRGKDLNVSIQANSLSVKLKNSAQVLVEGTLFERVVPSESTWTMEGGILIVVLYKHKKLFWATILQGDDKIDTTLVDNRRKIDEYDQATQAQIRKIIFDQSQAQMGRASSDEILGQKPEIPATLPPGVEYINQETLDKHQKTQKEAASKVE